MKQLFENEDLLTIATREHLDSLPKVSLKILLYIFLLAIGLFIPWAIFFEIPITTIAKGKLEPSGKVFQLDAPTSGKIVQVNIKTGQKVKANQKLLNLDKKPIQIQIRQIQGQLDTQQKQLTELRQTRDQEQERLSILHSQIEFQNAGQQSAAYSERLKIRTETLEFEKAQLRLSAARNKANRYQKAQKQGALSQDLLANIQEIVVEEEQNVVQAETEIVQAESNYQQSLNNFNAVVSANKIAIAKAEQEVKDLNLEIVSMSGEIQQLQTSEAEAKYQLRERTIRSPVNGEVFDLTVAKPGSVVEQGELLATIADQKSRPIFVGQIESKNSGFLKVGMKAKVKLDSYAWREFGAIPGKVTLISPTTYTNQDKQEVYRVEIELEPENHSKIDLSYGQTGKSEITVKKKKIINFWLKSAKLSAN